MTTYNAGEKAPGGLTIENTLNIDDESLPFGFFNPETEGKLTWICNYGPDGDIVSVFSSGQDRDVKFLKDLDEAKYMRDELIKHGWRKLKPPKIEFTVTSEDGSQRSVNRKERRYIDKQIEKASKRADS